MSPIFSNDGDTNSMKSFVPVEEINNSFTPIITVEGLTKSYDGHRAVLDNISFKCEPGKIVGLLGPNGCGKTTLLKILSGLITDYSGKVLINGYEPGIESKAITAFMPDKLFIPAWMNPTQAVNYMNDFFTDFDKVKAFEMIDRFSLPRKQKVKAMSKGMQEKLFLTLIMSRAAKLYLLDEPLGGVDPAARQFILDTILGNYAEDSTILISTHLITDVEHILDHILMISDGEVRLDSSIDEIKSKYESVDDAFKEAFSDAWKID